jgi:hypothetical protein
VTDENQGCKLAALMSAFLESDRRDGREPHERQGQSDHAI